MDIWAELGQSASLHSQMQVKDMYCGQHGELAQHVRLFMEMLWAMFNVHCLLQAQDGKGPTVRRAV